MSVGLAELDTDHKELIRIINRLADDSTDETRRVAVRTSLIALQRYAEYHFGREEKVMSACGYPDIEAHKLEHRRFVERIRELNVRFAGGEGDAAELVNQALLDFLRNWLNHHILIEDMAYRPRIENDPRAGEAARTFAATEVWWSR